MSNKTAMFTLYFLLIKLHSEFRTKLYTIKWLELELAIVKVSNNENPLDIYLASKTNLK